MAASIITSTRTICEPPRQIVSKPVIRNLSPVQPSTSRVPVKVIDDEPYLPPSLRIRINVSGQSYETKASAFDRHPYTLFGDPEKRRQYWDARRREYFFDRHRPSFEAVFAYIVEGRRLTRPAHIPVDIFLNEVAFYDIEPEVISALKKFEGIEDDVRPMPTGRFKQAAWRLFEYPDSSTSASIIGIFSVSVTLFAILMLCIETMPFAKTYINCKENVGDGDELSGFNVNESLVNEADSAVSPFFLIESLVDETAPDASPFFLNDSLVDEVDSDVSPFFLIESVCVAWFTFELFIRFVTCPSKVNFWKDFKNLIDITSVLPFYVDLIIQRGHTKCPTAINSTTSLGPSLSYLRSFRLARIFKLTKHCVGLQVLIKTFTASFAGLGMFMLTLSVCVTIYSSILYYAELNVPESTIHSIPDAFWWAIITMTTVGYGDAVPVGFLGRIVGTACAVSGILTLAIPVPIIAGHFNRFYSSMTGRHHHVL